MAQCFFLVTTIASKSSRSLDSCSISLMMGDSGVAIGSISMATLQSCIRGAHLFWLRLLVLGKKSVGKRALDDLSAAIYPLVLRLDAAYLESSPQAEYTVVRLLGWQTLQGQQDCVRLLGNQVIGSIVAN